MTPAQFGVTAGVVYTATDLAVYFFRRARRRRADLAAWAASPCMRYMRNEIGGTEYLRLQGETRPPDRNK